METQENQPQPQVEADKTPQISSLSMGLLFGVACVLSFALFASTRADLIQHAEEKAQLAAVSAPVIEDPYANVTLEARSAYVLDVTSGTMLYGLNPDVQLPLASITKVPLVLAAVEVLNPDETIRISRGAVERGEGGGLGTGDEWRAQDLVDFTLLMSSNAGAEALAEAANERLAARFGVPTETATVWRMNELARALGLSHTYFLNPSGLDASATQPGAVSTAREIVTLMAYAAEKWHFFASTKESTLMLGPLNGEKLVVTNTNDALSDIPSLILGKTGYTDLAGGNLAVVYEAAPERPVAIVVLGSSQQGRFSDMRTLIETTKKAFSAAALK